jgi:hypothetical protein
MNVREGRRRLLIVLAFVSFASITATTWAWFDWQAAEAVYDRLVENWTAPDGAGAQVVVSAIEEASFRYDRFIGLRFWTLIGHLAVAGVAVGGWVLQGFLRPSKVSLTTTADPSSLTGSADTGPPADMEG